MNTYLTIMVTVLVATQVIRIIQNTINLAWQNKAIKRDLSWIKERNITREDFDCQREVFYLLRDWLKPTVDYMERTESYMKMDGAEFMDEVIDYNQAVQRFKNET